MRSRRFTALSFAGSAFSFLARGKEFHPMSLHIRKREPKDDPERRALGDHCERTADATIGGPGLRYDLDPHPALFGVNLVAMTDGRIVGFLDGDQVMSPDETGKVVAASPPEGYIHCIGVHPDCRRQGIGKELLMAALREYEEAGFVRVELCTPSPSAARFFLVCGGQRCAGPQYSDEGEGGSFEWHPPLKE
jgi:ribosomal protein S18 acetylase RimI-like enzyme